LTRQLLVQISHSNFKTNMLKNKTISVWTLYMLLYFIVSLHVSARIRPSSEEQIYPHLKGNALQGLWGAAYTSS
jgi:hypothetical protein